MADFYGTTSLDIFNGPDESNHYYFGFGEFGNLDSILGGTETDTLHFTEFQTSIFLDSVHSVDEIILSDFGGIIALSDDLAAYSSYSSLFNVFVAGGAGIDEIDASAVTSDSPILISGEDGDDIITGGSGDDTLDGGGDIDTISGGGGGDTLIGGSGSDSLTGGDGDDVYVGVEAGDIVDELLSTGMDTVQTALTVYTMHENTEILDYMGAAAVSFNGNAEGNTIEGSLNNADFIWGGDGGDTLNGFGGADTLRGEVGDDRLNGGNGTDTLEGGAGPDYLDGGRGHDFMAGGEANDYYVVESAGDEVVEYANEGAIDAVSAFFDYTLSDNVEQLGLGGSADLAGTGNSLDNYLFGNSGANKLLGLDGIDGLYGGGGRDELEGGTGGDTIQGGGGIDTAVYAGSAAAVVVDLGAQFSNGGDATGDTLTGIENLAGSALADTLVGDANVNVLSGGVGADVLNGGAGNDTASFIAATAGVTVNLTAGAGSGNDAQGDTYISIEWATGGGFADTLIGSALFNVLSGGGSGDTIQGWGANDMLNGESGADSLDGGVGTDILTGGTEADTFVLAHQAHSVAGAQCDQVIDFGQAELDKIDVSLVDAKANTAGNDAFTQFLGAGAFTAEGQIRAFQSGLNTIVEFNTAGAAAADMQLQLNNFTAANLSLADFIL